jgi:hypothetical protein
LLSVGLNFDSAGRWGLCDFYEAAEKSTVLVGQEKTAAAICPAG